jgi:hypothetical protein
MTTRELANLQIALLDMADVAAHTATLLRPLTYTDAGLDRYITEHLTKYIRQLTYTLPLYVGLSVHPPTHPRKSTHVG